MITAKITPNRHLSRMACVYIRQSTTAQVRFNQESTERQYNLASKAQSLGWSPQQSDSRSRPRAIRRPDNEPRGLLVAGQRCADGQCGSDLLARSLPSRALHQDWHRLPELCAITNTLVIDEDGCYDPAEFNDGLVLGMKGTLA